LRVATEEWNAVGRGALKLDGLPVKSFPRSFLPNSVDMKIVLATITTPFIDGGAEYLIRGLQKTLTERGHRVERLSMPFRFSPIEQVVRSMAIWESEDLTVVNGQQADQVICLQFPTYYLKHPNKALWLLHQFRAVYDLWDTSFASEFRKTPGTREVRDRIIKRDTESLAGCSPRLTIARNVSSRLERYNRIDSTPVYHPPFMADQFYCAAPEGYVFAPSRLEEAKRQELLIRAMAHVNSDLIALICGEGGQRPALESLVAKLDLQHRVRFVGRVTDEEKLGLYAHSLCVFFGPFDEDYGYVTLEAMLASKPVITCTDSGGPLEFVVPNETGLVVEPDPEQLAQALDLMASDRRRAAEMGTNGLLHYTSLKISWENIIEKLLSPETADRSLVP
jgi:glycosyltransferase involved in cell wall biosynthesis